VSKNQNYPKTQFDNIKSFTKAKLITLLIEGNKYNCSNFSVSGLRGDPLGLECLTNVLDISKNIFKNKISIHTNGLLLEKFNPLYFNNIGLTISLFSFNDETNKNVMKTNISNKCIIRFINNNKNKNHIKLSKVILKNESKSDIEEYLDNCIKLNINRVVLRKNCFEKINIDVDWTYVKNIYNNPIFIYKNRVEVTLWDYNKSTLKGLYLYPDGIIRDYYTIKKE
jgi:hypothetical protein